MIIDFQKAQVRATLIPIWDLVLDAEYEPYRAELTLAGLNEEELRQMDPDDRVAVLEQARLDPYNYIYLAC